MNPGDSIDRSRQAVVRRACSSPCLLYLSFALAAAPLYADERRVALVIGNSGYERAPLENPANDAADVAALLRDERGFETMLHLDLDQRGMGTAIREFGESMHDADVRLFYCVGHGVGVDGANYLIPIGAGIESEDEVRFAAIRRARAQAAGEPHALARRVRPNHRYRAFMPSGCA